MTSASASALAVGLNGATNPAFLVDASTALSATGLKVKSGAAAGGLALSVVTSGTNENLTVNAAGSGTITLGSVSTGAIVHTTATTLSAALTYGGVALSNAVTGTGNMVLSASPTLTGTLTAAAASFSGNVNYTSTFQVNGNAMTFPAAAATLAQTVASGTSALGTGAIGSASCATTVTTTATGTATTDAIIASFNADPTAVTGYVPLTSGMLTIIGWPTTNNVNWKVCNNTSSSITPGAITINWRVAR